MNRYVITTEATVIYEYNINAKNKEEAEEKFQVNDYLYCDVNETLEENVLTSELSESDVEPHQEENEDEL